MSGANVFRLALVAATLGAASTAGAQRPRAAAAAASCVRPDTTAEWHRTQRAWLDESQGGWASDSLRAALLSAAALDASRPLAVRIGAEVAGDTTGRSAPVDSATRALVLATAANRQAAWFGRGTVGPAGVRALWMLAARDTSLERGVLHRMMEAGPDESLPADVATMEDRVRVHSGRKQLYGTQLRAVPGRALPEPYPIEDPSHVDLRRDAAGLPPLKQAICAVTLGAR